MTNPMGMMTLITPDQLTNIITKGEQFDVEFKFNRLVYALYGLIGEGIAVVEGDK